jgi:hypothetical protein
LLDEELTEEAFALRPFFIIACLALAACGNYPRDVSGTLDRIESSRKFTVGLAALRPVDHAKARALIAGLERATGARATVDAGPLESQLARLEAGELDLVVAEIAEDSPWTAPVAVIEPLSVRREGERTLGLSAVAANGENQWIAAIERQVRDSLAKPHA